MIYLFHMGIQKDTDSYNHIIISIKPNKEIPNKNHKVATFIHNSIQNKYLKKTGENNKTEIKIFTF